MRTQRFLLLMLLASSGACELVLDDKGRRLGVAGAPSTSSSTGETTIASTSSSSSVSSTSVAATSSSSGCGDTMSSAANCGMCGHSCLGGDCTMGQCEAFIVAGNQDLPTGIAVDKSHVYWTNYWPAASVIRRATKTKGASVDKIANSATSPASIITNGTPQADAVTVYWTTYASGVFSADASPNSTPVLLGSTNGGTGIARSGSLWLFWTHPNSPPSTTAVSRVRFPNNPADNFAGYMPGNTNQGVSSIVADGVNVYWADATAGVIYVADPNVMNPPSPLCSEGTATGACTPFASNRAGPFALALDGTNVYWSETGTKAIYMKPRSGGNVVELAKMNQGDMYFGQIAIDGANVYWGGWNDGNLRTVPIPPPNTTPAVCDSDATGPTACKILSLGPMLGKQVAAIAVDDAAVYWVDQVDSMGGQGLVAMVAK